MNIFRIIASFTPCMVCLCWFITFALNYRRNDTAKHMLTAFLAVCVILYGCHAFYFTTGIPHSVECLWTLCSLSVYPLYFAYICRLTSRPLSNVALLSILLPGLLIAICKYLIPNQEIDLARKVLNCIQIVAVCSMGYRKLQAFDLELAEIYADTTGRDTRAVKHLLVAFVITSVCSAMANAMGKEFFAQNDWLLLLVLTPFSVMLYALSYIGFTRTYTIEEHQRVMQEETNTKAQEESARDNLGKKLECLMKEEQYFLTPNLTISDVAKRVGVCRTYVSKHINQTECCTFSDYINRMRVEFAKTELAKVQGQKLLQVAEKAGFSSEQAFYRNFRKYTGYSPIEWLNAQNNKAQDGEEETPESM